MSKLKTLGQARPSWGLNDFVAVANDFLPHYLPEDPGNSRVREDVTPRLVRHYTSLGMLDEALKEGREARYEYRHLLQLLVVRKLLAEGIGANAIGDLAKTKRDPELEGMLEGGMQVSVAPANPALAYLQKIKERAQPGAPAAPTQPTPSPSPPPMAPLGDSRWTRVELVPGLELHIREDFQAPKSPQEHQNLMQHLTVKLMQIQQRRKK